MSGSSERLEAFNEKPDNAISDLAITLSRIRESKAGIAVCVASTANDQWSDKTFARKLNGLRLNGIDVGGNPENLYGSVTSCTQHWTSLYVFRRGAA